MATWREDVGPPWYGVDDAIMRTLEVFETRVDALGPARELIDLGDAMALFDRDDPDPFFNRVGAIRWPTEPAALDSRIRAVLRLFEARQRQPYLWLPSGFISPPDLPDRLRARGFIEVGGGARVMLHVRDPRTGRLRELPPGASIQRLGADGPGTAPAEAWAAAGVVAEAFGVSADRSRSLALEIAADVEDPAADVRMVRVDGVPAAGGRRHGFDRMSYLSAIGVRAAYQGLGLGEAVTRALVEGALGAGHELIYLGVYAENDRATRMYRRVGFEVLGGTAAEYLLP
ncbi:MAG: GNAT family N-acetyltransferase [Chloroflexota bacterium]|nr:GNAT family N-acetyltransferase [Chloroflexota bacterium]